MVTTFEPGQYVGKVTRWALVKAKNENKTPQFAITFLPLGRVNPQNPEADLLPCPEVERTVFRPITDKTAGWLLRDLKQLFEYPHESFVPLDPDGAEPFDFKDKEFPAVLTYEPFDGKAKERWNFAAGLNLGEPMSQAEVRIQYPNCGDQAFLKDPTCGGTRTQQANWGSSINFVGP